MVSSKTLIRTGVSLMTRFLNQIAHPNPNPITAQSPQSISPRKIFPALFIPQSHESPSLHFPKRQDEDFDPLRKLSPEGFLYPSGLPYLPFFLPEICLCNYCRSGPTNQATSGAKEIMDSLLERRQRVVGELLLEELQRVGLESQHNRACFEAELFKRLRVPV